MRIAIIQDDRPARRELFQQLQTILPDAEIAQADSGETALARFQTDDFDVVFIDVGLKDLNGIVLAGVVRKLMPQTRIVFVSDSSEHAVQAFELGATDYILRPFDDRRLKTAIQRCSDNWDDQTVVLSDKIVVKSEHRMFVINARDILYIETNKRSSTIHTTTAVYTENLTIGEYEKKLSSQYFYRIHKSYLVNLDMITELFLWQANSFAIKLKGIDQAFPVSRERTKELRKRLRI